MKCPHCGAEYSLEASGLTPTLARVVGIIHDYMQTHDGLAPSFEEIKQGMKVGNRSVIFKHLRRLEQLGVLTYTHGQTRSITLL